MRKKILFGMIAMLALVAVAGERYFNRANGQDIPLPQAPASEKNDLFNLLKKDLEKGNKDAPGLPALPEAKKDAAPTFPAMPALKKDEAKKDAAPTFPAIPALKKDEPSAPPTLPPTTVIDAPKPTIPQITEKKVETPKLDVKPSDVPTFPPPVSNNIPVEPKAKADQAPSFPPLQSKVDSKKPASNNDFKFEPAKDNSIPSVVGNPKPTNNVQLPSNATPSNLFPESQPAAQPTQLSTVPKAVTLPKNSPWALSVVMVDGQTIVTATVNKKHEFKILCQTLDLQTGKGTLKATGKVQINGDALNGTCENLSISLMEDRLLLQGAALVSIDRSSANVSDSTPGSFELKGDTLNLRISELQTASAPEQRPVDARPASRNDTPSRVVTASMKLDGTQWTPYGRLRAVKSNANMWSLESSNGTVIAYLLAREGGSLERYVGQNISVYGTREREQSGQAVLRVTHIALPGS